jgi:hypothetical protein
LHILFGDTKEMHIKISKMGEAAKIDHKLHHLPDEVENKHPESEAPRD